MNNCAAYAAVHTRHCLPVLLGLCLLLVHPWALGGLPALYGKEYVRDPKRWEDGSPRSLPVPRAAQNESDANADKRAYLEQIQLQERSAGPYADGLTEPLTSLGRLYRDQGNYDASLGLYKHALHVVRVNDGLDSKRQIPLLRELLDTYRLAGDMQALDERYDYFFRLYGNGYPPYTPSRLQANLEYLRWQREAFLLHLDGDRKNRLVKMYQLNKRILESATQSPQLDPNEYERLVLNQILNLYLVQSEIVPPDEDYPFGPGRSIFASGSIHSVNTHHSNTENGLGLKQQQLEDLSSRSVSLGRTLLEDLIARIATTGNASELARTHLELGDWLQWNGKFNSAQQEYSSVIRILKDAGDTSLLEQWLGSPVELPDNGAFWQPFRATENSRQVVLTAQYDVSARGRARKLQVGAAKPEDKVFTARLHRKLTATRFRPRFISGAAAAVSGVSRQYELTVH